MLWSLVYFLPILSGTIADQIGFRRSLLVAFVLLAARLLPDGLPGLVRRQHAERDDRRRGHRGPARLSSMIVARDPAHRRRRLGHQAVHLGHRAEDRRRAGHARLRHLLHGDQHRLAVRPRHGVRRAQRLERRARSSPSSAVLRAGRGRHRPARAAHDEGGTQPQRTSGRRRPASRPIVVARRGRRCRGSTAPRAAERVGGRGGEPVLHLRGRGRGVASWRSSSCSSSTASRRRTPDAPAKPKRSVGRILLDMVLVLRSGRFTLFLVVMTGFFFLYNQVYNVLPLYVKRVVETEPGDGPLHRRQPVRHRLLPAPDHAARSAR